MPNVVKTPATALSGHTPLTKMVTTYILDVQFAIERFLPKISRFGETIQIRLIRAHRYYFERYGTQMKYI